MATTTAATAMSSTSSVASDESGASSSSSSAKSSDGWSWGGSTRSGVKDSMKEVVAGAGAGAMTRTLVAPLDRLKLVVQLRGSLSEASLESNYRGPWQALRHMIQEEGFWALWRGNTSTIVIQGGTSALNFMFMDLYQKMTVRIVGQEQDYTTEEGRHRYRIFKSFVSGGLAGGTAITFLYPIAIARTKLALDVGNETRLYKRGMRDVIWKSYHTNGITSLYRGYSVALVSVSLYRMVHLGGYDYIKTEVYRRKHQHSTTSTAANASQTPVWERLAAAQLVSILASTVHYPFDSIRRRLMMQSDVAEDRRKYRNAYDCWVKIYRQEGYRGYYRGLGTTYIRSIGAALLLVSYDFFKTLMQTPTQQ